jgi:hypothetical protein
MTINILENKQKKKTFYFEILYLQAVLHSEKIVLIYPLQE